MDACTVAHALIQGAIDTDMSARVELVLRLSGISQHGGSNGFLYAAAQTVTRIGRSKRGFQAFHFPSRKTAKKRHRTMLTDNEIRRYDSPKNWPQKRLLSRRLAVLSGHVA